MEDDLKMLNSVKLRVRSQIHFWNNYKSSDTGKKLKTKYNYYFFLKKNYKHIIQIKLFLDLHVKENNILYNQQSKVKKMIDNIENSMRNSTKLNINISDIIQNFFDFQIHLRNDLKEINWPPNIIGRVTETNIEYANVNITNT